MPTFLHRARLWRSLGLVAIGVVLGAMLVAPVAAANHGQSKNLIRPADVTYTRTASCAGLDFYPTDSASEYGNTGTLRWHGAGGSGTFRCDPGLPNGAVVTKAQFTLYDAAASGQIDSCNLVRSSLDVTATTGSYDIMASVGATGIGATPGTVRMTATSIFSATVNHGKYGYWFECHIGGSSDLLGIFGASATFTITASKG